MPLHKSAEKRLRQSERRNARNRSRKKELKVLVKTMQKLIDIVRLIISRVQHMAQKRPKKVAVFAANYRGL